MKRLTYSAMARARLRANKRQYRNLILGIFLSIFLVTSLTEGIYGSFLAQREQRYREVGYVDAMVLDNPGFGQKQLKQMDIFDKIGHSFISGVVTDRNLNVGCYDEEGLEVLNLVPTQGRLPNAAGEFAMESSALDILEIDCQIGDTVELNITPVEGEAESRGFTLVGFLPERSERLANGMHEGLQRLPALVTSMDEPIIAASSLGVNYVMQLKQGVSRENCFWMLHQASLDAMNFGCFTCLSFSGEEMGLDPYLGVTNKNPTITEGIRKACILGGSLLLCCGIGIFTAMESMLSGRQEEIGVLRAVGATRRQIRRMFGRENWLLALLVSPLSLAAGSLAMWGFSRWLPEATVFRFQPWLLLPIGVFSAAVVLLAGFLPLMRASRNLPMGVIRDTTMLRRGKKIKTKKLFSPSRLISNRQLRFHPVRQIGAAVLVCLMLICFFVFVEGAMELRRAALGEKPALVLRGNQLLDNQFSVYRVLSPSISRQSIEQLENLEHVKSLTIQHSVPVTMLLDRTPRSALYNGSVNLGMLDDAMFDDYYTVYGGAIGREDYELVRLEARTKYQKFLESYEIDGCAYDVDLSTVTEETLNSLRDQLESGRIDLDAINAGREVIAVVRDDWVTVHRRENGDVVIRHWTDEQQARMADEASALHLTWNDSLSSGQTVSIAQLYQTEADGQINRDEKTVTIGGVYAHDMLGIPNSRNGINLLTTQKGLANLAVETYGRMDIGVYLEAGLTEQEEAAAARRVNAIARRTNGCTVTNQIAQIRNKAESNRQKMLMASSVCILFFAVSVGMMVSSVSRQLQSEGRTIGMLRAVGADEKTVLRACSGQFQTSIAVGLVLCLLIYWAGILSTCLESKRIPGKVELYVALRAGLTACIPALACAAACWAFLRLRVRQLLQKSIIDTIREL